ncbi:MAG: metallophosphoesterase [Pseudomonadales bacterium]|nr:metallophosphoesterase [Pseudomonadales bacterium]
MSVDAPAQEVWENVPRIVAIGDVHGDYEQYLQILKDNQLIDAKLNWQGGGTHLVQLGDIPDRGPDSQKIMRHLRALARQAKKTAGFVHTLLGNHELMNITGDLRFVDPGEYEIFINADSRRLRAHYLNRVLSHRIKLDPSLKALKKQQYADLKSEYPLGYVEHRLAWAPTGKIFKWIKKNNAVIKINRILFAHGGISPHAERLPLHEINHRIKTALQNPQINPQQKLEPLLSENGPLWYRGLYQNGSEEELAPLIKMLAYYDADAIVIAHTPTPGAIIPRFDGRVILVDVGLATAYGKGRASLLIDNNDKFSVHRGHKVKLPDTDEQLLQYLTICSEFDPDPSALLPMINQLTKNLQATH